jgi:hypothetical protein
MKKATPSCLTLLALFAGVAYGQQTAPVGAVARCGNGWYVFVSKGPHTCVGSGGVADWLPLPSSPPLPARTRSPGGIGSEGTIANALRNIQRYMQGETFDNPQGGAREFGPSIQFDTKGVEFGPWIRFIAQIKQKWFIPSAAMSVTGQMVVTFYVHTDTRISELTVPGPCDVDAFNNSAYNALAASNPTQPLPPEYPADRAFFTVTFYYSESPVLRFRAGVATHFPLGRTSSTSGGGDDNACGGAGLEMG